MKAAVVPAFNAPLEIRDIEVPTPQAGQVLVRIEASGLCHTDIHGRARGLAGEAEDAPHPGTRGGRDHRGGRRGGRAPRCR